MSMTETEKHIARGVYDAMYPGDPNGRVKVGVADGDIEGFLDELGASWEWLAFTTLRVSFIAVAIAAVFIARSFKRFDELSRDKRTKVLYALYSSDNYFVRQLITMQKATAGFLYGAMIRDSIAPGRAPEVDQAFVAWRKLVPAKRGHDGESSESSSKEAA